MIATSALFTGRVARRILGLFVICALLPVGVLTVLSLVQVNANLQDQSASRRRQASRALGMTVMERLLLLENDLAFSGSALRNASVTDAATAFDGLEVIIGRRYDGLIAVSLDPPFERRIGAPVAHPNLSEDETSHLLDGKTLLSTRVVADTEPFVFMTVPIDPRDSSRGYLTGRISRDYLWKATSDMLPNFVDLCIIDATGIVLYSTQETPPSFLSLARRNTSGSHSGEFEWRASGREFMSSYRSIYMKPSFHTPKWTIVVSESKDTAFAPIEDFKRTFLLVVFITIWIVLLLSISQIRRSMLPLQSLKEATGRIARRDFAARAQVTSTDEFGDVATSFNSMASQLGRQFSALAVVSEIDRAILSALDEEAIVDTLSARMGDVVPCDALVVGLIDGRNPDVMRMYDGSKDKVETPGFTAAELAQLVASPESIALAGGQSKPHYLQSLVQRDMQSFLILPLFLDDTAVGIVALGWKGKDSDCSADDVARARQMADQVAVALSNAKLVRKLDDLNWGTLTALARAIDAKSPWTAGHSERVVDLSVRIAAAMGLDDEKLDIIRRGALLHDVGKIGVPLSILDKKGKLTDEEMQIIRGHVKLGVRILEPIDAFADVVPIIAEHHERFDGSGYPNGLAGTEIDLGARIFAVADCFDALSTDRPYRRAIERDISIDHIRDRAGTDFDPEVVDAFLAVIDWESKGRPKDDGKDDAGLEREEVASEQDG